MLLFYCKRKLLGNAIVLQTEGPLLIAANHPNSFFDAIVLGALFKQPIYFLARGDAFTKPFHRKLLSLVNAIPIYRISEGKENLHLNKEVFAEVVSLWQNKKVVLIFIEGVCKHTHQFQPFKKGAAKMLYTAWQKNIPVQVLPIGLGYSSLSKLFFNINIGLGILNNMYSYDSQIELPQFCVGFNRDIQQKLQPLVTIPSHSIQHNWLTRMLHMFFLPLLMLMHPLIQRLTKKTVFYHSVFFVGLIIIAPIYLCLVISLLVYIAKLILL